MKATAWVGWIVAATLCLGGCGIRHLNAPAKARLNVIGVAPAQYRPRTIIPPAPASLSTAVGQSTLHYSRSFGAWFSTPMAVLPIIPAPVMYPAYVAGAGLSVTGSLAGAAYGSAFSLLQPPPEPDQARRMTGDLQAAVAALDCQQRLAATFLAEAASSPHQFQLLDSIGQSRIDSFEQGIAPAAPFSRLNRRDIAPLPTPPEPEIPPYHQLVPAEIHSVLELSIDKLQFFGTVDSLTLVLQGRARLLIPRRNSPSPAFRHVEAIDLDFTSDPATYQAWSANDRALLQTTLEEGCRRLSRAAIERWFY